MRKLLLQRVEERLVGVEVEQEEGVHCLGNQRSLKRQMRQSPHHSRQVPPEDEGEAEGEDVLYRKEISLLFMKILRTMSHLLQNVKRAVFGQSRNSLHPLKRAAPPIFLTIPNPLSQISKTATLLEPQSEE